MYAIDNGGSLVKASPARALQIATANNNGKRIGPKALPQLTDAELVRFGVRRLDSSRPPAPSLDYQEAVEGSIVAAGDRATQQWTFADLSLDQAKRAAHAKIEAKADNVRSQGVVLDGKAFATDDVSVTGYVRVGGARGAGISYPENGIPFKATNVSNNASERVRLNHEQFTALAQAVQDLLAATADAEDALLNAVDAAASVGAVRAIDVNDGWPAKS